MQHRRILSFVCIMLWGVFPVFVTAAQTVEHAGFIPTTLWFAPEPFFEGDEVRIYTVVYNSTDRTIAGTVTFADSDTVLGSRNIVLEPQNTQVVWADWQATGGDRRISAQMSDVRILDDTGAEIPIVLAETQAPSRERFVDTDTDGDRIGNRDDDDDDNDGVPDTQEKELGTDPLVADTDRDGLNDSIDPEPRISSTNTSPATAPTQTNTNEGVVENAIASLPAPLARAAQRTVAAIETAREHQAQRTQERIATIELALQSTSTLLSATPSEEDTGITQRIRTPLQYISLVAHHIVLAVLQYRVLFYLVLAIIVWYVLRFIFKRFR